MRPDLAIVQTVDFFTPIVDDPYDFGRIAAANALSDIYAMGATPVSALNIAAFPEDLDLSVLEQILAGGAAIAAEANVAILGGHTIKDPEPKYGMAVTGIVDPTRMLTNANARPGDMLVLTKAVGTGVLTTAFKEDALDAAQLQQAVASMTRLNANAADAASHAPVHAATDISGYGLLGHAAELARASDVALDIDAAFVPLFSQTRELIDGSFVPRGTRDNLKFAGGFVRFAAEVDDTLRLALCDAQTSGGLLLSVPPQHVSGLEKALHEGGDLCARIGTVGAGQGITVH